MTTVQNGQTRWHRELRGAATYYTKTSHVKCAKCANHRVVVDGSKTHHLIAIPVRDENFARRRHNGDTIGIRQRAGGSRQLSHPGAIRVPQHCHPTVGTLHHEEEGLVGSQRQAARLVELAGLNAPRTNGAMPLALQLKEWEEKQKRGYLIKHRANK